MGGFEETLEDIRSFLTKTANDLCLPKKKKGSKRGLEGPRAKDKDPLRIDRFRNVFAKPLENLQDFVSPVHEKTPAQKALIAKALKDNFVFKRMDAKSREKMIKAMEAVSFSKGHVIITQGEIGDYMYVIETGKVTYIVDKEDVGTGSAGQCFGELALLYDSPRAATVVCTTVCQMWRVSQSTVRKLKATRAMEQTKETRDVVHRISFLKDVNDDIKNRIAVALVKLRFQPHQEFFQKGEPCETFYYIKEGQVKSSNISIGETHFEDMVYGPGDYFGQSMIESGEPWLGSVTALTEGLAYTLSRKDFVKILGGLKLDDLIAKSREQRLLAAIPILATTDLNQLELKLIQEIIVEKKYKEGHVFTKQGKPIHDPAIYIIRKGTIDITKKFLRIRSSSKKLSKGEYFGDDEFVPPATRGKRGEHLSHSKTIAKHTIVATSQVTVGVLTLTALRLIIWDLSRLGRQMRKNPQLNTSITLESLEKHKILGAGTFGQVWLASPKNSKTPYALKIQYKRDLIRYNQVEGVLNEKTIMEAVDHPFVIGLINSYKDKQRVYMLMQLIQGGELFAIVHNDEYDGIPEDAAIFYAAGILEGLSYMHRRRIIHRDIKLENVLIDKDGYCVLVDLGFAKKIIQGKTYTCCGTPIAMAPEVILGEGHDQGADYWSLGIYVYDMVVGVTPFYKPGMHQMQLYEAIVKGKFYFPSDVQVSPEVKNLVQNLLLTDPSFRLGCLTRGDLDIRDHSWFNDIDFVKLYRKELETPWVPAVKDPFDVSNYDDWSKVEKEKQNLKPLSYDEEWLFDTF